MNDLANQIQFMGHDDRIPYIIDKQKFQNLPPNYYQKDTMQNYKFNISKSISINNNLRKLSTQLVTHISGQKTSNLDVVGPSKYIIKNKEFRSQSNAHFSHQGRYTANFNLWNGSLQDFYFDNRQPAPNQYFQNKTTNLSQLNKPRSISNFPRTLQMVNATDIHKSKADYNKKNNIGPLSYENATKNFLKTQQSITRDIQLHKYQRTTKYLENKQDTPGPGFYKHSNQISIRGQEHVVGGYMGRSCSAPNGRDNIRRRNPSIQQIAKQYGIKDFVLLDQQQLNELKQQVNNNTYTRPSRTFKNKSAIDSKK